MIEREIVEVFVNKKVGIVYSDSNRDVYISGILQKIVGLSLIIDSHDQKIALSLECIQKIKEL